jgi:hypothetical protein
MQRTTNICNTQSGGGIVAARGTQTAFGPRPTGALHHDTYVMEVLLGLHPTPLQAPMQGSPLSQPWLEYQLGPLVASYSCTRAARWAGGTPGTTVPDGLGVLEGEGEPEGLGDHDDDGVGAGDDDTGPAQGEHQGCLA